MSGDVLQDGDVIVRRERTLRRITLNRPKALNALTLDMGVTIARLLFLVGYSQHGAPWRPEAVPVAEVADLVAAIAQALNMLLFEDLLRVRAVDTTAPQLLLHLAAGFTDDRLIGKIFIPVCSSMAAPSR